MKSLTLHKIDDVVYQRLVEISRDRNLSLNSTAKSALGNGLGLNLKKKKRDFSMLFGMWTEEEGKQFDKYLEEETEQIDLEDWK